MPLMTKNHLICANTHMQASKNVPEYHFAQQSFVFTFLAHLDLFFLTKNMFSKIAWCKQWLAKASLGWQIYF